MGFPKMITRQPSNKKAHINREAKEHRLVRPTGEYCPVCNIQIGSGEKTGTTISGKTCHDYCGSQKITVPLKVSFA